MFNAKVEAIGQLRDATVALLAELREAQSMGGPLGSALVDFVGRLDADQNISTFAAEAAPGGAAWPALNPAYAARKRKAVGGRKKLVWDGSMRASATTARGKDRIARVAGRALELGTSHPLARKHQFGEQGTTQVRAHNRRTRHGTARVRAHAAAVRLPARPFIGKSAAQEGAIRDAITRVLTERLVRVARGRLDGLRLRSAMAGRRLIVVER